MSAPSTNLRRIAGFAAAPVAILAAGALVWNASSAAFTATTRNAGNSWSTGQVTLTDDDKGAAGFTVTGLVPGQHGEKCLVVKSTSTVAGEVRTYVQNLSASAQGLQDRIIFKVEQGTGGSFNDCTGFVADAGTYPAASLTAMSQANHDYATGGGSWATSGTAGETKTYKGSWTFDTTGMTQQQIDSLQGATVSMDMVWELQSATPQP
ncbi:hypothetical protein Cch01nite_00100 [Cellulomonas chitinilytica]|uniref:Camelysin metallo-endopeptidase n=1 Tax=Cellulomonas chitinilytica TaxID=398759 RepID=A0A919NX82_9CELL|nr:hypothetical protein [Cellulomonas chitinilytica]GIG19286.1 hypothetical protein Cch01nite_00100 [Cellulomonas chitinilytica]